MSPSRALSTSSSIVSTMKRNPLTMLAILLLSAVLAGCGGGTDDAAPEASAGEAEASKPADLIAVEVAPVSRRDVAASYSGTATLEAPSEATVVAKTSGVLLDVLAEEGERVRAGQRLAKIDPERTQLEVQRAEAVLRKLEAEYRRSQELFERKLIAADAHERIRYDLDTQRAVWELAKLELSYTNVVAPIDGVIAQRLVKQGNLVQLSEAMFRIVDVDPLEAVLNVPERELATIQPGMAVNMSVDAVPGETFVGEIARVSPVIDAASGTFRVTAEFDAGQGKLKPGMFGRLSVVYDRRADVLTVPREALLEGSGEPALFVVREGKAVRTPVRLGYVNGGFAEVVEGVSEGDRVVTTGKVTLRDGVAVQVINDEPAADTAVAQNPAPAAVAAQP